MTCDVIPSAQQAIGKAKHWCIYLNAIGRQTSEDHIKQMYESRESVISLAPVKLV
jgi:hypothetical protein